MRPRGGYCAADGKRVPSVTTVIGHRQRASGLIHWAWNEGREGRYYRQTRDSAASKGQIVHSMIEQHQAGADPFVVDGTAVEEPECLAAFAAFSEWFDSAGISIVVSETSLVSETHRYGGTLDAMLLMLGEGEITIGDWKTSNRVYGDHVIQLAAYAHLWTEVHPEQPVQGGHLLRFDKGGAGYEHHPLSLADLSLGFEVFERLLAVYHADKALERIIGRTTA